MMKTTGQVLAIFLGVMAVLLWGMAAAHVSFAEKSLSIPEAVQPVNEKQAIGQKEAVDWRALTRRFPGVFVTSGPRNTDQVALTFDDVPDPRFTGKILDILGQRHVRATFFVVGWRASRYPELVRRINREGHAIGNHSYSHTEFSRASVAEFERQVKRTNKILQPLIGYTPRYIRPPYGEITSSQLRWAQNHRFVVVNWDVDSIDWKGINRHNVLTNIKKTLRPGSIILMHAGGGVGQSLSGSVQALPALIQMLKDKGYRMVTVPELLGSSVHTR